MYILLGAVVFVAPQFSAALGAGASITKVTTALLYVVGAVFGLVQSIPVLMNANAAADRMEQLDIRAAGTGFDRGSSRGHGTEAFRPHRNARHHVPLHRQIFRRRRSLSGRSTSTCAPGELVFITGGNGSGKSTFLRVLVGTLSARLRRSHARRHAHQRPYARRLSRADLGDFLRLPSVQAPVRDPRAGRRRSQPPADPIPLGGQDRRLPNGEFRTLDLSGGQRRRLALIVSLLEKRPILLLDEWTAEQDPEFRRKFYDELLPELMRAGTTVVVITHDDRYLDELHLPARSIKMDEGRIVDQRSMS